MDARESFGYWVRRRRKALDLTQEELAQCVGCAMVTLRKIEADERRPSPQMAERLAYCLALPASAWPSFVAAAVGKQTVMCLEAPALVARMRGNLPAAVTALVGRDADVDTLTARLQHGDLRLLTITGPVGVGKTQLAIEVGRRLAGSYRDGAFLIELAAVRDPGLVPSAIATVLGIRESRKGDLVQLLIDNLTARSILLIVDNFEHLLLAAPILSSLLAGCPELRLLVTSRARLHLYGEHEYVLAPLQLPDPEDLAAVIESPAVRLFCARAQAARADFRLTPSLTPAVVAICRELDGLPLAIELAAARSKLFAPNELQQRLAQRLLVVGEGTDERQSRRLSHLRVLENAIAWSYGLLTPAQQRLLARLAVFAGGFSLPAAEAVCTAPGTDQDDVADSVDVLLDQSLLVRETTKDLRTAGPAPAAGSGQHCVHCPLRLLVETAALESRFAMLETIHEFALDRLVEVHDLASVRRRHAEYFVAWAEQAERELDGPDQVFWLASLERNSDNLRTALSTLVSGCQAAPAARLVCALGEFWQRHGHYREGRQWLQQVLALLDNRPVSGTLQARTLQTAATMAYRQGDWPAAQQWLAQSLALYQEVCDQLGTARILFDLGWIAIDQADWAEGIRLNQASLALARETGDALSIYRALTNLGWTQLCAGQYAAAVPIFDEALGNARRVGHVRGVAVTLANLAWIAHYQGDTRQTEALAQESLRLCCQLSEGELQAECLELLAIAATEKGEAQRAVQLSAAAEQLHAALHILRPTTHHATVAHAAALATMRRQLSEAEFAAAWHRGRSLRMEALMVFALRCGGAATPR